MYKKNKFHEFYKKTPKSGPLFFALTKITHNFYVDVEWEPTSSRLAVCTGTNKLYLWNPAGCVSVEVPTDAAFHVTGLSWSPDGSSVVLKGKDQFCVAYLQKEET